MSFTGLDTVFPHQRSHRRFFTHLHPQCPLFLYRREPNPLHSQDNFLFWSIICVTLQKPALDPVARAALEGVSYAALAKEVKKAAAHFGIKPPRKLSDIQGFLLLCEWPLPANRQRDDRVWHYSSLVSGSRHWLISTTHMVPSGHSMWSSDGISSSSSSTRIRLVVPRATEGREYRWTGTHTGLDLLSHYSVQVNIWVRWREMEC